MTAIPHNIEDVAGVGVKSHKIVGFARRIYFDYAMLKKALGDRRFNRSLEIGCGFGRMSSFIAEYSKTPHAIDTEPEFIKLAKKHFKGIKFAQEDVMHMWYADDYFDLVVSVLVLSHFTPAQLSKTVDEIRRVAKSGALIYLHETTKPSDNKIRLYDHDYKKAFHGFKLVSDFKSDKNRRVMVFKK